jgi:hypothetical protein
LVQTISRPVLFVVRGHGCARCLSRLVLIERLDDPPHVSAALGLTTLLVHVESVVFKIHTQSRSSDETATRVHVVAMLESDSVRLVIVDPSPAFLALHLPDDKVSMRLQNLGDRDRGRDRCRRRR